MWLLSALLVASLAFCTFAANAPTPLYSNDFSQAAVGEAPKDLSLLDGAFAVHESNNEKFLELPGDPLKDFGFLFGPDALASIDVSVSVWGAPSGRRMPEFGVGSHNAGGYKLWVWPAGKVIEIRRGDKTVASAPFAWKPSQWTRLRLRVRTTEQNKCVVEGKAWARGDAEPENWLVSFNDTQPMKPGRASAWGAPYSGQPIRFDDLVVGR